MTSTSLEPPLPCRRQALQRFVGDTLRQLASVDITCRADLERTLNLIERLLAVLGQPTLSVDRTMRSLLHGGTSERAGLVARLYRDLKALSADGPDGRP